MRWISHPKVYVWVLFWNPMVNKPEDFSYLKSRLLTIGPKVVPFWGSYLEFYKVIPKRNYFGAYA